MYLSNINNLVELFYYQFEKQKDKNKILLSSLKDRKINLSWKQTSQFIFICHWCFYKTR